MKSEEFATATGSQQRAAQPARHQDRVASVLDQCQQQIRDAGLATIWY